MIFAKPGKNSSVGRHRAGFQVLADAGQDFKCRQTPGRILSVGRRLAGFQVLADALQDFKCRQTLGIDAAIRSWRFLDEMS